MDDLNEFNPPDFDEALTPQQRALCLHYIVDYDIERAGREVGLSKRVAETTLRKKAVAEFLCQLQDENFQHNLIREDYIRTKGIQLFRRLMGEEDFISGRREDGKFYVTRKFYAEASVKMWQELAKGTKFYQEGSSPGDKAINSLADIFKEAFSGNNNNESK